MNEFVNDGDPWTPVDASTTSVEELKPEPPLEVKGGDVTAHINLGDEGAEEEKPATEEEETSSEEEGAEEEDSTTAEVEDAEARLAEKLAALDAAKSSKKTKR